MSVGLAQVLDMHLNPMCRDEIVVTTMLITVMSKWLVRKVSQTTYISNVQTNVKEKLRKLKPKFD
jgi:hypothetical protein